MSPVQPTSPAVNLRAPRNLADNAEDILMQYLLQTPGELGIEVHNLCNGGTVLNANNGRMEAAILNTSALLGKDVKIDISPKKVLDLPQPVSHFRVELPNPVVPCMASQYAGLQFTDGKNFIGMGSGPMRAVNASEDIITLLDYDERLGNSQHGYMFLEGETPTEESFAYIANKLNIDPKRLSILGANTDSLVGRINVAARSVETALHALHCAVHDLPHNQAIEYFRGITYGKGECPIVPATGDDSLSLGTTNDAIRNGTSVTLTFTDRYYFDRMAEIAADLPVNAPGILHQLGKSASDILAEVKYDFSKVERAFTVRNLSLELRQGNSLIDAKNFGPTSDEESALADSVLRACLSH